MAYPKKAVRRPILCFCLLVAIAWSTHGLLVLVNDFVAPVLRAPAAGVSTGSLTGSSTSSPWWNAAEDLRVPRPSAAMMARTLTYTFEAVSLFAMARSALRSWLLPAPQREREAKEFDKRRFWTLINVGNHAIYAILFVIRSLFYTGAGGSDRPFYYESFFLGYLCGPAAFLPKLLGWDNGQYNQPEVLRWMTAVNSPSSTVYPAWMTPFVSSPTCMYWYQIAEGTFHFMIVLGGMRALFKRTWPPKEGDATLRLFRWGLWLELIIMDVAYVIAYSCFPMLSVPGHWGLTTIMMLIHHVNVLPDIMCAWHEWKASRPSAVAAARQLAAKAA